MVYRSPEKKTAFVLWKEGEWKFESSLSIDASRKLVPYSPNNNLIKNEVVLFPSEPEEYGSEEELVKEIRLLIHRYVDVSPLFEKIASYYVLFSWVHDGFNELPYLRVRGDPGSGKTRFLLISVRNCSSMSGGFWCARRRSFRRCLSKGRKENLESGSTSDPEIKPSNA